MYEGDGEYCEVVDVLARTPRVPRMPTFFRALKESPAPFDATVDRNGKSSWRAIDFLIRGRRGVTLEVLRSRTGSFRDRMKELQASAEKGSPRRARNRVKKHLEETRLLYRLRVRHWVETDEDWHFIFMLGAFLCEFGQAILHNPTEGFVLPGEGRLLKP